MTFKRESTAGTRLRLIALTSLVALLAGCYYGRIQDSADLVEMRFLGQPAASALNELGAPSREHRVADLRSYTWETGEYGRRGGNCTLTLIADPRGTVVDYNMRGTPLGCHRLLRQA
jgi:hypothetical protein